MIEIKLSSLNYASISKKNKCLLIGPREISIQF